MNRQPQASDTDVGQATPPVDRDELLLGRLREMGASVDRLRSADEWQQYLKAVARLNSYSVGNMLLIFCRYPDARLVNGPKAWHKLGRRVVDDAWDEPIMILAPRLVKDKKDPNRKKLIGFKPVRVYELRQTEGQDLPDEGWELPPKGEVPGLWEQLVLLAESDGVTVAMAADNEGPPGALGWYNADLRTIKVREQRPDTLLHELSHHFDPELAGSTRAARELVAESCAAIVADQVGLDVTTQAEKYLAGWGGGEVALLRVLDRVQRAHRRFAPLVEAVNDGR